MAEFKIKRLISGGLITNYFCTSRLVKMKGVIDAARKTGIGIFPWVSDFLEDLSGLDANGTHSLTEFESMFGPDYMRRLPQRILHQPVTAIHPECYQTQKLLSGKSTI